MSVVGKLHVVATKVDKTAPWNGSVQEGTGSCVFVNLEPGPSLTKKLAEGSPGTPLFAVTCAHVVQDAHPTMGVSLSLGEDETRYPVHVLGSRETVDMAVLAIPQTDGLLSRARTVDLGDDRSLRNGDELEALGYSLGFPHAKRLPMRLEWRNRTNGMLEMDSGANPGMSGGAVLKDKKLVGLVQSKLAKAEGLTFVRPASHLRPLLEATAQNEIEGIAHRDVPFNLVQNSRDYMDFKGIEGEGVVAQAVRDPALTEGDVVLAIRDPYTGKFSDISFQGNVRSGEALLAISDVIQQLPHGAPLELRVVSPSDNNKTARDVAIEPKGHAPPDLASNETFGLFAVEVSRSELPLVLQSELGRGETVGSRAVVVGSVYPGSIFKRNSAVSSGHLVSRVNGKPVGTMDDYRSALRDFAKQGGEEFVHIETVCGQGCRSEAVARVENLRSELPLIKSLGVHVGPEWARGGAVDDPLTMDFDSNEEPQALDTEPQASDTGESPASDTGESPASDTGESPAFDAEESPAFDAEESPASYAGSFGEDAKIPPAYRVVLAD